MKKIITITALAALTALAGCSDSGIREVDQARDRLVSEVGGSDPGIERVAREAEKAVKAAEQAGRNADLDQAGQAVAKGTKDLLATGAREAVGVAQRHGIAPDVEAPAVQRQ